MDVIKWIDNRTILKVYRGSHSYGTNHENSDIDFGGICIPPKEYIIGFENFEQYECKDYINYHNYKVENNKAEATIFSLHKFINLASNCNPNIVEHLFVASTHDTILFFTEKGRCYWMRVYEIPEGEKQSKGRAIQNLIQLPGDDKVKAIINVKNIADTDFVQNHYIVLCTKQGIIKKTSLEDFSRPRANGVNAITIVEGDELLEARLTNGSSEIMLAVKSGRAIRFPETKVRPTGRGAIGVAGIEVDDATDEVVGMICVNKDDTERTILVVSEKGYGKRTAIEDYRITNRGGKGVKTINVTEKTGSLVGILYVKEVEDLIITCKSGITIRTGIVDIREAGRATQGVKLIRLDEGDEIAAISQIEEQVVEEVADEVIAEAGEVAEGLSDSTDLENASDDAGLNIDNNEEPII